MANFDAIKQLTTKYIDPKNKEYELVFKLIMDNLRVITIDNYTNNIIRQEAPFKYTTNLSQNITINGNSYNIAKLCGYTDGEQIEDFHKLHKTSQKHRDTIAIKYQQGVTSDSNTVQGIYNYFKQFNKVLNSPDFADIGNDQKSFYTFTDDVYKQCVKVASDVNKIDILSTRHDKIYTTLTNGNAPKFIEYAIKEMPRYTTLRNE